MFNATVISSVIVFSLIIIILVIIISIAEKNLLPQGDATILINGDGEKSPTIKPGGSLLSSLASHNVFIPSACGGGRARSLRTPCRCRAGPAAAPRPRPAAPPSL